MFTFPKTTTVREIQRNYKKVFEEVKKSKQPVVVLKNNKPDVAIVDVERLEEMNKQLEEFETSAAIRSAQLGMNQYKRGKTVKVKSLAHLDAEYWKNLWKMIGKSRSIKGKQGNLSKFIAEDRYRH